MNRNLVLESSVRSSNKEYMTHRYNISPSAGGILSNGCGYLEAGKQYTITICITPGGGVDELWAFLSGGYAKQSGFILQGTQKQILTKSFIANYYAGKTPQDGWGHAQLELYCPPNDLNVKTSDTIIHWIKIEEGSEFTGYCPAPEDVPSYHLYEDMFERGSFFNNSDGSYERIKTGATNVIRSIEPIPISGEKMAIHVSNVGQYFVLFLSGQTNLKLYEGWNTEDKWIDIPPEADHFALALRHYPNADAFPADVAQICGGGSM